MTYNMNNLLTLVFTNLYLTHSMPFQNWHVNRTNIVPLASKRNPSKSAKLPKPIINLLKAEGDAWLEIGKQKPPLEPEKTLQANSYKPVLSNAIRSTKDMNIRSKNNDSDEAIGPREIHPTAEEYNKSRKQQDKYRAKPMQQLQVPKIKPILRPKPILRQRPVPKEPRESIPKTYFSSSSSESISSDEGMSIARDVKRPINKLMQYKMLNIDDIYVSESEEDGLLLRSDKDNVKLVFPVDKDTKDVLQYLI